MAGLKMIRNDFQTQMSGMLSRSKSFQAAGARIYSLYQKFQTDRFMTEGGSEKQKWPELDPTYKKYKQSRYGGGSKRGGGSWKSWPGNGTKMLIGTSTLAGAVIGPGAPFVSAGISKHKVLFTATRMQISVDQSGENAEGKPFNYASIVNEDRNFMKFSDEHLGLMGQELMKFVIGIK